MGVPTGHPSWLGSGGRGGLVSKPWTTVRRCASSSPLAAPASPRTRSACRPPAADASPDCGAARSRASPVSSVEYYARLERGQIAGASSGVLDALARALQLDETERAHLFDLARAADGIPTSGRPRRRTPSKAASRLSLQWALEAITDGVAFVRDPRQNLLATNALGRAFYSPVIGDGGRTPNLARFQFLDPASRDFYPDWDLFAEMCVGDHARRGRPRPARPRTAGPRRRALHAERGLPAPLGRPQRPHPRRGHQALPPPRRRRADPRLRGARHHRRTRARAHGLHRRTRFPLRRTPPAARLLGGTARPHSGRSPTP